MAEAIMEKGRFLMKDRMEEIKSSFSKQGWLTIFESNHIDENDEALIYCCIVEDSKVEEYLKDLNWAVQPGYEGSPVIIGGIGKDSSSTYQKYSDEGFEPFLFRKNFIFSEGSELYIDVSEDFVNYFNLYEKGENKQTRSYYKIDDLGELIEVINITPDKVKIKTIYLKEYISIRKVHFSISFDFMRTGKVDISESEIAEQDKDFSTSNSFYNHMIRPALYSAMGQMQSSLCGKVIINFDPEKTKSHHMDYQDRKHESFIVGYNDQDGSEILLDCRRSDGKYFIMTYFRKEVLNKYYNEPTKYKVDGWRVSSNFFSLKIDNNVEDYVPVFLVELSTLPHKEQLHWKQYNIGPQKGMSNTYHQTMMEGNWVQRPETPDLLFKHLYIKFNKDWESKFGWKFHKELAAEDQHLFTSLHLPPNNNVKAFCEQILTVIKLTVDRLNEAEISKNLTLEKSDRGISKLQKFLSAAGSQDTEIIIFLRSLYDLRSGLLAHSFSSSNKACEKAIKYFGITGENYNTAARDIFTKSNKMLATLYEIFLDQENFQLNEVTEDRK